MIYTTNEIREKVAPVAKKYGLRAVYLFGSYARGEATEESDVDLLIDTDGSRVNTMFKLGGVYNDLEEALGKEIDLMTTESLEQEEMRRCGWIFLKKVNSEKLQIYNTESAARKENVISDGRLTNCSVYERTL